MKITINNNFIYKLFLLSFIVGNVITISFAKPLEIDSRNFSIPYRAFIIIFSLFIIYKERKNINGKNISIISLVVFWIYYLIKLIYSFNHYAFHEEVRLLEKEYIFRVLLIVLLPSIALLSINYREINFKSIAEYSITILSALLIANYIYNYFVTDFIFSTYYIMYGHIGASLYIISLFLLLFCRENYNNRSLFLLFFCLSLGLFNTIESIARSPVVAVSVCTAYLFILKGSKKYLWYIGGGIITFIGLVFLHERYGNGQIISFNRVYKWIAFGDTTGRGPLFTQAFEIFKSNWLWGGRVLYQDGNYPHNIFLELLMATGVLGFIIYFLKFLPVIKNFEIFWNSKKSNIYYKLIFALFLQYFTLIQTSCNLFDIPEFLYFSSMIIGISFTVKNGQNLNTYSQNIKQ